jgi:hypothetical protein
MNTVSEALGALAAYQREYASSGFVVRGPPILTEAERASREVEVRAVSDDIETLAAEAESRPITYNEIEPLLARFRAVGKFAPGEMVSKVARAIASAEAERLYG